ncbi:hypothetical protein JOQ06_009335, partial [Pogonophryne albipinna]
SLFLSGLHMLPYSTATNLMPESIAAERHTDGGALEETLSLQIKSPVQQMVRQRQHVQTSLGATSNHVA